MRADWDEVARRHFDLLIVGGGIYGACLFHAACASGLSTLLVERADYGGGTTANSYRILHGGLRYLQSADFPRFLESVNARRWFMRGFPDIARPADFLMPLYGRGLRSMPVMRIALALNDAISSRRNVGVSAEAHLPPGRMLDVRTLTARFPSVRRAQLQGAAVWHDAIVSIPGRLVARLIGAGRAHGGMAINYAQASGLEAGPRGVDAVWIADRIDERRTRVRARAVCVCAGPWTAQFMRESAISYPDRYLPSLAFNVLLGMQPFSKDAVAVSPAENAGQVCFLYPAMGGIYAGTAHAPLEPDAPFAGPTPEQVRQFTAQLDRSIPGLGISKAPVRKVFWGRLPVTAANSVQLAGRAEVIDYGRQGGPANLYSIVGVKLTTAPQVAARALRLMFPKQPAAAVDPPTALGRSGSIDLDSPAELLTVDDSTVLACLREIIRDEQIVCREDLLQRRTNWGYWNSTDAVRERLDDLLGAEDLPLARAAESLS